MPTPIEELIPWQAARAMAAEVHRVTRRRAFDADPTLRWQMRRAAGELMASIAGAHGLGAWDDVALALASSVTRTAELKSFIYLGLDVGLLERRQALGMLVRLAEVTRLLEGCRRDLLRRRQAAMLEGRGWVN